MSQTDATFTSWGFFFFFSASLVDSDTKLATTDDAESNRNANHKPTFWNAQCTTTNGIPLIFFLYAFAVPKDNQILLYTLLLIA